jgi:predicted NUDIX family NTP pyrophosphohydrolase
MAKFSAGILVYRNTSVRVEVLLAHPGGPFWDKKDSGVWSIIKGEYGQDEKAFDAAKREFKEETSHDAPEGEYLEIGEVKRKDGKSIRAWAVEADFDIKTIKSNTFEIEWPPRSGRMQEFPENDRAEWFKIDDAIKKINKDQIVFIERLAELLNLNRASPKQQLLL